MSARSYLLLPFLAVLAVGCGQGAPQGRADEQGRVALKYVRQLSSGRYGEARTLVAPTWRNEFNVITDGLSGQKVTTSDLSVGRVVMHGSSKARVTVLGRFCSVGTQGKGDSSCIDNADARTRDPRFQVELVRVGNAWRVTFNSPLTASR